MSQGAGTAPALADVIAFVDEAGPRGYLRDLKPASDDSVSVLCALPIPAEHVDRAREAMRPAYDAFCDAAPPDAKIHITDAFKQGNEAWGAVARQARDVLFDYLREAEFRVVYAARRFRVARATFEMDQTYVGGLRGARMARGPSNIAIPGANRPSDEQVDDRLMKDLTLILDTFMDIQGFKLADFHFDEITDTAADRFQSLIDDLRKTGDSVHSTTYRDLSRSENFTKATHIKTTSPSHPELRLNVDFVGQIKKVGKGDPLIFATDIVTNSLWRHLNGLGSAARLNEATALVGWPLAGIAFVETRPGASLLDTL